MQNIIVAISVVVASKLCNTVHATRYHAVHGVLAACLGRLVAT